MGGGARASVNTEASDVPVVADVLPVQFDGEVCAFAEVLEVNEL